MHQIHLEDKVYPQPDNKVIQVIETADIDLDEIEAMLSHRLTAGIAKEAESYLVLFKSGRQMGVRQGWFDQVHAAWTKPMKLQA